MEQERYEIMVDEENYPEREVNNNTETFNDSTPHIPSSCQAERSVEGWVLFIRGIYEECTEDDLLDHLTDAAPGTMRNLKLNPDHRTGYAKGYALVEYGEYEEALQVKEALDNTEWMGSKLQVDFAFRRPSS